MVRQVNYSNESQQKPALTISAAMYERKALDCTSILPLIASLNNLAYLVANNRKIRDLVCTDGGLERLIRILRDVPKSPHALSGRNRHSDSQYSVWRWTTAFQCMVHLCIRGGIHVRERAVEAGIVPILVKVLESYLCFSDAIRNERKRAIEDRKRSSDRHRGASATSVAAVERRRPMPDLRHQYHVQANNDQPAHQQSAQQTVAQHTSRAAHTPSMSAATNAPSSTALASPHHVHPASSRLDRTRERATRSAGPSAASGSSNSVAGPSVAAVRSTAPPFATATPQASSSRTSSLHSQSSADGSLAGPAGDSSRPTTSVRPVAWSAVPAIVEPSADTSSAAVSSSSSSSTSSSMALAAAPTASTAGTLENVSSAEDLREGGSASGSEGAEEAEMSADGDDPADDSEAETQPTQTTGPMANTNDAFTRAFRDATRSAAHDSEGDEDLEERRTPRANRRTLAPLTATTQARTHPRASSPRQHTSAALQETPRAPSMPHRGQTSVAPALHLAQQMQVDTGNYEGLEHERSAASHAIDLSRVLQQSSRQMSASQQAQGSSSQPTPSHHTHGHGHHQSRERHSERHSGGSRVRPVLPTTYIAETFDPNHMPFREEEVLLSLQILAYLTKYSHIRALLRFPEMTRATNMKDLDDIWEKAHVSPGTPMWQEGQTFQRSIYTIAERYTCRATKRDPNAEHIAGQHRLAPLIQYWAAVVMRNACRKDDREDDPRSGLRQCGNMLCGKWEREPREFAKCRRCKKAKFCSKVCQSTSWQIGHKYWCSTQGEEAESSTRHRSSRSSGTGSAANTLQQGGPGAPATNTAEAPDDSLTNSPDPAAVTLQIPAAEVTSLLVGNDRSDAAGRNSVDLETTPRLGARSAAQQSPAEVHRQVSHALGNEIQAATNAAGPSTHTDASARVPMRRLPSAIASAVPSRIVSEAHSSGLVSDVSEDEGDRRSMVPASDNEFSETERSMSRGPPPAPIRTDLAGRPLPPPVIAGAGMELATGQGLGGRVGLDGDDTFIEFLGGLEDQFGQGNVDQIPWEGQMHQRGTAAERDAQERIRREFYLQQQQGRGDSEPSSDADQGESSRHGSRRRGTVTQAMIPAMAVSSASASQDEEDSAEGTGDPRRLSAASAPRPHMVPGLGLPSGIAGGHRFASAAQATGQRSSRFEPSPFNPVRRVPSSDLPTSDLNQYLYGGSRGISNPERRDSGGDVESSWQESTGNSAGESGHLDQPHHQHQHYRGQPSHAGHGSRGMNHHQHLLMRGDMAASMMGRSATPEPLATPTISGGGAMQSHASPNARYHLPGGVHSALSSPSGRSDALDQQSRRDYLALNNDADADMAMEDQHTPLSERPDPFARFREGSSSRPSSSGGSSSHHHHQRGAEDSEMRDA